LELTRKSTRKILGTGEIFTRSSKLNTESLQWENDLEIHSSENTVNVYVSNDYGKIIFVPYV